MSTCWRVLTRKKVLDPVNVEETRLARVLNTFDLTALGVGSTLGVGVYVIAGHVAKDTAGPAVVLSFLIAAIASVFAGLCYAEFGARVPRAGSAYIYSYVCVGEFIAFVIGWNLILEYVIGSASVARGLSLYLDMLINNTMQNAFIDVAPINIPYLSRYFDFFAFSISVILAVALAFGLKESSLANNIFTSLNICVVLFVVIAGAFKADVSNWHIKPDNSTAVGDGGFFPFGIEGMLKGAATCFYGFVGFDCIATTGEEVKNPRRAIPISIILSLFIIFLAYLGTSTIITLMVPYYLQNPGAPLPYAFEQVGWDWAKWIASLGGIFGQCASLFGAMFPLPRILYAMANDSLVFRFLGRVSPRFQTPVIGTILAGLLTGSMAALFELKQLVDMMSLGTFLAYTIVAASILILRYTNQTEETRRYIPVQTTSDSDDSETYTDKINLVRNVDAINEDTLLTSDSMQSSSVVGQLFNSGRHQNPTKISETIVRVEVCLYCVTCLLIALSTRFFKDRIAEGNLAWIILISVFVAIAVLLVLLMVIQPMAHDEISFKVPLVPLIPALSIMINIYLMVMLDYLTWIRFAVWMAIGLPTYYFSVRPYSEAENKNITDKSSVDTQVCGSTLKHNGELASYANYAFESEEKEINGDAKVKKKKPAPLVPIRSEEKIDTAEIQQELDKFEKMLDDAIVDNSSEHRLSIGSVSVSDIVVSGEQNVVAVVHYDDVAIPVKPDELPLSDHHSNENVINDIENNNSDKIEEENKQSSANITNFTNSPENNFENISVEIEDNKPDSTTNLDTVEHLESTRSEDVPTTKSLDNTNTLEIETPPNNIESQSIVPSPPPPPLLQSLSLDPPENSNKKLPSTPPSTPIDDLIPTFTLHRPTSANLKSVTLRKTKKEKPKEIPNEFEPDNDNLRVGSEKYKQFKANLDDKLRNSNVVPNYIPVIYQQNKNIQNETPKEKIVNENVIEESINQKDAKEKLVGIIETMVKEKTKELEMPATSEENNEEKVTEQTKEKVDNEPQKVDFQETDDKDLDKDTSYIDHKNRMKSVFRSINLKHTESFSEKDVEKPRNINSWGHGNEDKIKHRKAMGDIFQTIKLRRKDSQKEIENS